MRPQRETALGLPAPWGSGLPSLPLGSWWGEASAWDQCCSFLTAHSRRMMTGRGPQRVHGGHRLGPWALAQGITVLVSHIPGRVHTTHASTHPILLSGQMLARSHTHSPSLPHTWSQSKSESYCCAGGWGVRGGYSTKSENSTITTMPMQSRSTCCRECHGSSSSKRSGSTFTRAM